MEQCRTVLGRDVSKKTVVPGVLPPGAGRVTESKVLEHQPTGMAREVRRLMAPHGAVVVVEEAGPCGDDRHRQITPLGARGVVVAPGVIPQRPTDRVKTDRRDAEKLARLSRAGGLTALRLPTRAEEAARDLGRAREDALADPLRARHRLSKFLLRQGRRFPHQKARGVKYRRWLKTQRVEWSALQPACAAFVRNLEERTERLESSDQPVAELAQLEPYRTPGAALRSLKGIETLSALTLVVEVQDFRRLETAAAFRSFTGLGRSEHRSGERVWRGSITKAGNAHSVAAAAVARELAGFVWALGHHLPHPAVTEG